MIMAKSWKDQIITETESDEVTEDIKDQSSITKELKAEILDAIKEGTGFKQDIVDRVDADRYMIDNALKDLRSEGVLTMEVTNKYGR